jgi:hypothetical protein
LIVIGSRASEDRKGNKRSAIAEHPAAAGAAVVVTKHAVNPREGLRPRCGRCGPSRR